MDDCELPPMGCTKFCSCLTPSNIMIGNNLTTRWRRYLVENWQKSKLHERLLSWKCADSCWLENRSSSPDLSTERILRLLFDFHLSLSWAWRRVLQETKIQRCTQKVPWSHDNAQRNRQVHFLFHFSQLPVSTFSHALRFSSTDFTHWSLIAMLVCIYESHFQKQRTHFQNWLLPAFPVFRRISNFESVCAAFESATHICAQAWRLSLTGKLCWRKS